MLNLLYLQLSCFSGSGVDFEIERHNRGAQYVSPSLKCLTTASDQMPNMSPRKNMAPGSGLAQLESLESLESTETRIVRDIFHHDRLKDTM